MPLRMPFRKTVTTLMLITAVTCGIPAPATHAGPLFDHLFGLNRRPAAPAYPVGGPVPVGAGYAPYAAAYAPYGTRYSPFAAGYSPYGAGYSPYGVATAPYATAPYATAPYAAAYAPYRTGYAPYTAGYSPVVAPYAGSMVVPSNSTYAAGYGPAVTVPAPISVAPATSPAPYGTYYGAQMPVVGSNGYGYLSQRPAVGAIDATQAVMPSTVPVTVVPDYRSTAARTPVTYYRPLLTTDPATGQQVVTMAPCTSYEYQTQRVPTWGLTPITNGGATLPATTTVAPQVTPTYSLPRGGVPLAGPLPSTQPYATAYGTYPAPGTTSVVPVAPTVGSIITPAGTPYSAGYGAYATNYGNYSTLQPSVPSGGSSVYPTAPYGGAPSDGGLSPYYGSGTTSGGSTGSYVPQSLGSTGSSPYATTPGSTYVIPPSSGSSTTTPVYPPASNYPGSTSPSGSPVLPPSSDPAAGTQPVLPLTGQSSARLDSKPISPQGQGPQLQSVVQQPISSSRSASAAPTTSPAPISSYAPSTVPDQPRESAGSASSTSGLMPIPVPEDFKHEPRWNPGLLSEQDQTAAARADRGAAVHPSAIGRGSAEDPATAWGSKPIQWASFKQPNAAAVEDASSSVRLHSPKSQLRSFDRAEVIQPLDPLETPVPAARPLIADDVKMVPIPQSDSPAGDPAISPSAGSSLELSSSSGNGESLREPPKLSPVTSQGHLMLSPNEPATQTSPAQGVPSRSHANPRYSTGGWQKR